jgi:hypothetical protein
MELNRNNIQARIEMARRQRSEALGQILEAGWNRMTSSIKPLFVLMVCFAGVLSLFLGWSIFATGAVGLTQVSAASVTLVVGALCFWLARQTLLGRDLHVL